MENLLGAIAATISFVMWLPQARSTWRYRASPTQLAGISLGTQFLVLLNATIWGVYAVITGAYWSGAPGAINLPLALLTIYLVRRARKVASITVDGGCGCGARDEHKFFVTARPGYGVIIDCPGNADHGFPVPPGTRFDRSSRLPVLPSRDDVLVS